MGWAQKRRGHEEDAVIKWWMFWFRPCEEGKNIENFVVVLLAVMWHFGLRESCWLKDRIKCSMQSVLKMTKDSSTSYTVSKELLEYFNYLILDILWCPALVLGNSHTYCPILHCSSSIKFHHFFFSHINVIKFVLHQCLYGYVCVVSAIHSKNTLCHRPGEIFVTTIICSRSSYLQTA